MQGVRWTSSAIERQNKTGINMGWEMPNDGVNTWLWPALNLVCSRTNNCLQENKELLNPFQEDTWMNQVPPLCGVYAQMWLQQFAQAEQISFLFQSATVTLTTKDSSLPTMLCTVHCNDLNLPAALDMYPHITQRLSRRYMLCVIVMDF